MNSRYKKTVALTLGLMVMSACLGGCTLAKTEQQRVKAKDEFIGVFVTLDEDIRDYMMQDGDTLYFDEKKLVKADGSVIKLDDEQIHGLDVSFTIEGVRQKDKTYKFGDIEGYYIGYSKKIEKEGTSYETIGVMNFYTDGVYDVGVNLGSHSKESDSEPFMIAESGGKLSALDVDNDRNVENADESTTIKGTISVSSKTGGQVRINQVFKREDGSVYASIPGSSSTMIQKGSNQGSWTHNISESFETSITGTGITNKSQKSTIEFEVTVETRDSLKSANIKQMDKENKQIKGSAVDLSKKDQILKLEDSTAYVIIEENFTDEEDEPYIKRTAYDCERLGKTYENGYEVNVGHSFYITKENGKFGIVGLSMKR